MVYQAILFDLDGTLLPMDQDVFVKCYFGELCRKLCPLGIEPKPLTDAVWAGTKAMVLNDGARQNEDVFWDAFAQATGRDTEKFRPLCDHFYGHEFHLARSATGENPLAVEAVRLAHEKAEQVVLATNPLFPLVGQRTRLSWVGLKPEDFALVTSYESDRYCKPNPDYYVDIIRRQGLDPARCLMIGNDENEDMLPAQGLGMDTYLVTGCRIASRGTAYEGPQGTFGEMVEMLKKL